MQKERSFLRQGYVDTSDSSILSRPENELSALLEETNEAENKAPPRGLVFCDTLKLLFKRRKNLMFR